MFRLPSRKKKSRDEVWINIVPLLDATFVFLFFLMFSTAFVHFYEVPSVAPIASDSEPPPDKKPLALTLRIISDGIEVYTGVPAQLQKKVGKLNEESYNLEDLRQQLFQIKKDHPGEKTVILNPEVDLTYEKLVEIIDSVRLFKKTDPEIFSKDKDGIDVKVNEFFSDVLFGNIQS